jgi:ATP/maltotriose-dependent transcriptional regulator MalT
LSGRSPTAHLFLIPLGHEGWWSRYHHLFANSRHDVLSALHRGELTELHGRTSHWHALENTASQAVWHTLSEECAVAVDLLERPALSMITQGYAKRVYGWAHAIRAERAS